MQAQHAVAESNAPSFHSAGIPAGSVPYAPLVLRWAAPHMPRWLSGGQRPIRPAGFSRPMRPPSTPLVSQAAHPHTRQASRVGRGVQQRDIVALFRQVFEGAKTCNRCSAVGHTEYSAGTGHANFRPSHVCQCSQLVMRAFACTSGVPLICAALTSCQAQSWQRKAKVQSSRAHLPSRRPRSRRASSQSLPCWVAPWAALQQL